MLGRLALVANQKNTLEAFFAVFLTLRQKDKSRDTFFEGLKFLSGPFSVPAAPFRLFNKSGKRQHRHSFEVGFSFVSAEALTEKSRSPFLEFEQA